LSYTITEAASLVAIIVGITVMVGIIYRIALNEFKTTFMRIEDCKSVQSGCQSKVCSEISVLRDELSKYREHSEIKRDLAKEETQKRWDTVNDKLHTIDLFMTRIEPFLPIPQNHSAWEHLNGSTGRGFGGSYPIQKGE